MVWYAKRFADGEVKLRQRGNLPEFAEVFHVFAQTRAARRCSASVKPAAR